MCTGAENKPSTLSEEVDDEEDDVASGDRNGEGPGFGRDELGAGEAAEDDGEDEDNEVGAFCDAEIALEEEDTDDEGGAATTLTTSPSISSSSSPGVLPPFAIILNLPEEAEGRDARARLRSAKEDGRGNVSESGEGVRPLTVTETVSCRSLCIVVSGNKEDVIVNSNPGVKRLVSR